MELDDEMKLDQLLYWQSLPFSERFDLITRLSTEAYYRKHPEKLDTPPPTSWKGATLRILSFEEADAEDNAR